VLDPAKTIVVIPNLPNAREAINRPVIDWIRRQAHQGALIHSWCKGAMALAETGLLDGQTATAHWGDIPALEKVYPRVRWVRGVRWIDRGQYVMSAGITSGIDASLRVIIRLAGDSTARRVAREMRYPNYHFALDPTVEQYELQPSDLVLLANAAYRVLRPSIGVALYDGMGEMDLSNVYDAHGHTMVARVETVSDSSRAVVTQHGLTLFPSIGASDTAAIRELKRLLVPGIDGRTGARSVVSVVAAAAPAVAVHYLHADQPTRFGLEPVLEDLSRTADVPTARFAQRRMEFRSGAVRLTGPALPWIPLASAAVLAALGAGLLGIVRRLLA
jgi:putative intracellular protease/amidase